MPLTVAKILATAHHSLKSKAAQPPTDIVVLTKGLVIIKVQTVQANYRNPTDYSLPFSTNNLPDKSAFNSKM